MKKTFNLLAIWLFLILCQLPLYANATVRERLDSVWQDFRQHHPIGYQTVGLKHGDGDECIILISEPAEYVSKTSLSQLFQAYKGTYVVKQQPFGYDGWLRDVVGSVHFSNEREFQSFTEKLFSVLYGTSYKSCYYNLDKSLDHCYYSHYQLNYSITAEELLSWIVKEKERFVSSDGGNEMLMTELLNGSSKPGIYYSKRPGFVVWLFNAKNFGEGTPEFKKLCRIFSLDSDLILGAFGKKGERMAIVARERQVPVDVLPPLRSETVEILANSDNESLAQSYERHNVFGGKTSQHQDVAPIYLSDELWHTEYGNLLNVTDQMLKSWSENGDINYIRFDFYPKPIDWAFVRGAVSDMKTDELTYNWNTAGAGYVVPGDGDMEILAVNRTGSLPVSYIPSGMEGKAPEEVVEAEELAYDFFSGLNNPDLARVVQYATMYQIFQYFKSDDKPIPQNVISQVDKELGWRGSEPWWMKGLNLSQRQNYDSLLYARLGLTQRQIYDSLMNLQLYVPKVGNTVPPQEKRKPTSPDYAQLEKIVSRLIWYAEYPDSPEYKDCYNQSLDRYFRKMYSSNNVALRLKELEDNDPYGGFKDFLVRKKGEKYLEEMHNYQVTYKDAQKNFDYYLEHHLDTLHNFIDSYKKKYNLSEFPRTKAAHMVVCSSHALEELNKRQENLYDSPKLRLLQQREEELDTRREELNKRIERYNANRLVNTDYMLDSDIKDYRHDERTLNQAYEKLKVDMQAEEADFLKEYALFGIAGYGKSLGTLNWLLTDPAPYDEPVGQYFAQYLTTHGEWVKSPSIVSSRGTVGYGGHNLDAKVTCVKIDRTLHSGQSRVVKKEGKRVVYVSAADRGRVTTSSLREIERKDITGSYTLPRKAPEVRTRNVLLGENPLYSNTERGFRVEAHANVNPAQKKIFLDNVQKESTQDMLADAVQQILIDGKKGKVRFEHYSEQEVRVIAENMQERIMERSMDMQVSLNNFDINGITVERSSADPTVIYINIPEKMNVPKFDSYRSAGLELKMPSKVSEQEAMDAVKRLFELPVEKIDNRTKWRHELKRNLQKNIPELHFEDVHDDYYINYSLIINIGEDGIDFLYAA